MPSTSPDPFSRLHFYTVLHSLADGVTLANAEGRIVFSNEAADRILGVGAATEATPEEWGGHYGVFLPDRVTPFPTDRYPLVRALSGELAQNVEMFIRNPVVDGAVISVSGRPLRDAEGQLVGAAVVFRDVTELREAQDELQATVERLAATQRVKDELATFIVHDLKSPLTAILASCDLLAMGELEDESREDVNAIREAAQRIHRMVMDLLDVQMAEDGALELELSDIPLEELIEEVCRVCAARVEVHGGRIDRGDVGPLVVRADRPHLTRVLLNLVDNCLKYGPPSGTIWLGVDREDDDGSVVLGVRDEGAGVPPDLRDRIFEKYARVERDERPRSHTSRGLGLRFCRVIMEAHGGAIWVEDAEPTGTKFCLRVPRASVGV